MKKISFTVGVLLFQSFYFCAFSEETVVEKSFSNDKELYISPLKLRITQSKMGQSPLDFTIESCKNKSAESCYAIYHYYKDINLVKKAREYQILSCNLKNIQGCLELGSDYLFRENKPDEALKIFEYPCKQNDPRGCNNIAGIYEKKKNVEMALKFYGKACNLKFQHSCISMAHVKKESGDFIGANKIFIPLCAKDDIASCIQVGEVFILAKDNTSAKKFFSKVCDKGIKEGCIRKNALK
jgi:TPR repeat protein